MTNTATNFDPRTFYITLCWEITDDLRQKLIRFMVDKGYIGKEHRVSRQELAIQLLGKHNPLTDRKIRKAKEGTPILSTSGKSGYYLPEFQDEIDDYIKENNNRIASLQRNISQAKKITLPYQPPTTGQQPLLWERSARL
ncbi:MAG: hypothetical protein U9R53_10895 [Chloroflexota bacterium]|nr:hypothetical protein [Chloroflexota bacterium]